MDDSICDWCDEPNIKRKQVCKDCDDWKDLKEPLEYSAAHCYMHIDDFRDLCDRCTSL